MIDIIYETETADPDDLLALAFLARHKDLNLRGVAVTPGYEPQVEVIKVALQKLNTSTTIYVPNQPMSMTENQKRGSVNPFWLEALEQIKSWTPSIQIEYDLMPFIETLRNCTIITGCPPKALGKAIEFGGSTPHWVAQGGFAGANIVEPENQLEKFKGKITSPTWNFGGAPKLVEKLLESNSIGKRTIVSKNVCHGVYYSSGIHGLGSLCTDRLYFEFVWKAMNAYFKKYDRGKLMHDPLAATIVIDPSICEFKEVTLYREKGEWGSKETPGSNTKISVSVDLDKFWKTYRME